MSKLINGRTPEEIKQGLRCDVPCGDCAYQKCALEDSNGCSPYVDRDALALIEHLESERDAALAKVTKWISVKERLPEEAGKYIVCTRKNAVYCTAFRFFHGKGYFATDTTTHITHWMPMPEQPKEE